MVGPGLGAALGALAYKFVRSASARTVVFSEDAPPVSDLATRAGDVSSGSDRGGGGNGSEPKRDAVVVVSFLQEVGS